MQLPIGILNQDFSEYWVSFNIARKAFERGKLPPEKVMEILYEGSELGLPSEAYEEELQSNQSNLDSLERRIISSFVGGKNFKRKQIMSGDGRIEAQSLEHYFNSEILHIYSRVKERESFNDKSVLNVDRQNPTGFFDINAFTIMVEHPDAWLYRIEKSFMQLESNRKNKILSDLSVKDYDELIDTVTREPEKLSRFLDMITLLDLRELNKQHKDEYVKKYKTKNEETVREFAKKVAGLTENGIHFIPQFPLYSVFGTNLEVRIQNQVSIDHNSEKIFDIDYIMKSITGKKPNQNEPNLYDVVRGSISGFSPIMEHRNITIYRDDQNNIGYLIDNEDLVLNIRSYKDFDFESANKISDLVFSKYKRALARYIGKRSTIKGTGGKEKARLENKELDSKDSSILKDIKINMDDLQVGQYVYVDTPNFESRYRGSRPNKKKSREAYIKDRTYPFTDPAAFKRGMKDAKVYPNLDPSFMQICAELQIISPDIELTKKSHDEYKDEKIGRLSTNDRLFINAFLGDNGIESKKARSQIFACYYSRSIDTIAQEITDIPTIPRKKHWSEYSERESSDRKKFEELFGLIRNYLLKANDILEQEDFDFMRKAVSSLHTTYLKSKGLDAPAYSDSLMAINSMIKELDENSKINLPYFRRPADISREIHNYHIEELYQSFIYLSGSRNKIDKFAAALVGGVISNYSNYYGQFVDKSKLEEINNKFRNFIRERKWIRQKSRGFFLYFPKDFSGGQIKEKLKDDTSMNKVYNTLYRKGFPESTVMSVEHVGRRYLGNK